METKYFFNQVILAKNDTKYNLAIRTDFDFLFCEFFNKNFFPNYKNHKRKSNITKEKLRREQRAGKQNAKGAKKEEKKPSL